MVFEIMWYQYRGMTSLSEVCESLQTQAEKPNKKLEVK